MTTPMIERVAGVIFREFGDRARGVDPATDYKSMKVAALVLSAMREPSEGMVAAYVEYENGDGAGQMFNVPQAFSAMIDAALNETDPQ